MKEKNKRGITLVALVITVIVLLILAGTAISIAINGGDLFTKASDTRNTWNNAVATEETEINSALAILNTIPSTSSSSSINYGTKTAQTVDKGDTIRIGDEQFMVLKNSNGTIMAMPYYNITLTTPTARQTNVFDDSTKTTFSDSEYWTQTGINIDMTNSENNVQQYIEAYQTYLQGIAGNIVTTEIGRNYGDNTLSDFGSISSCEENSDGVKLLNPSGVGIFFVGSCRASVGGYKLVCAVNTSGYLRSGDYRYNSNLGVRPVVYISVE